MNIYLIASEIAPIAKVGGLGDVIYGLSKELSRRDEQVTVVLPKYKSIQEKSLKQLHLIEEIEVALPSKTTLLVKFWSAHLSGVSIILIDPLEPYEVFQRNSIYGEKDDTFRFLLFSYLALTYIRNHEKSNAVLHLHDWQSAFCASFYKLYFSKTWKAQVKIILTIHNIMHQGKALFWEVDPFQIPKTDAYTDPSSSECINLLKSGMLDSDFVTTVSKTYANEIRLPEFSYYLDQTIWQVKEKTRGILNGIDESYWSPINQEIIPFPFDHSKSLQEILKAKESNKKFLEKKLSLSQAEGPLFCVISRLDHQKGPFLIAQAAKDIIALKGQCIILGKTASYDMQDLFTQLAQELTPSKNFAFLDLFDETLSKLLYASSDFILIPSIFEPCGLTQMIAMRFGTVPIARKTGGLADTVIDLDDNDALENEKTGFCFEEKNYPSLLQKIKKAFALYHDHQQREALMKRILAKDFSWKKPANLYLNLYKE